MSDFEIVVTEEKAPEIISEAVQGPQGAPGNNLVGGYNVQLTNPQLGDVLSFGGDKFINRAAADLTDGGNF